MTDINNCPTCDRSFDTQHGLRVHHAAIHDERLGNQHTCEYCGEAFHDNTGVERTYCSVPCRNRAIQTGAGRREYTCSFCDRRFDRPASWGNGDYCAWDCYVESRRDRPTDAAHLLPELYVDEDHSLRTTARLARAHALDWTTDEIRAWLSEHGHFEKRPSDRLAELDADAVGGERPDGDESWQAFYATES